ncbi:MAG: hypothetical protein WDM79_17050 [Terricaulis sp.]
MRRVLFVAGSYLGAVSHALTGLQCLAARNIRVAAVIVSESEASAGPAGHARFAAIAAARSRRAAVREPAHAPAWANDLARVIAASG